MNARMTDTPFEQFFHGRFMDMIDHVANVPGVLNGDSPLSEASWDRKAAYLLWTAMGNRVEPVVPDLHQLDLEDVIAEAASPTVDEFEDVSG